MNIIETMRNEKLFGPWFGDRSWSGWMTFLRVLFALRPLTPSDRRICEQHTGRTEVPEKAFREAWLIVGRRGGKSMIAALIAVYLAAFSEVRKRLTPGERAYIQIIAVDKKQAGIILGYIRRFLAQPLLKTLIVNDTREEIELTTGIVIAVHTASYRSLRGYTILATICDEIAFWRSDEFAANPDSEILSAVRPGMLTLHGDSLLLCISSPYARRGELYKAYARYFGQNDPDVLVWKATSRDMNPALPESVVDSAIARDPVAAKAEYLAEFRSDVETFVALETLDGVVIPHRTEQPYSADFSYRAFVDPSGGGQDSFTLAIAHRERNLAVLDVVRESKPPFNPAAVVEGFAEDLKRYQISTVTGDAYAGEWPRERFRDFGISYEVSSKSRAALYTELLPMLNSGGVELLDHPRLLSQLVSLERRQHRSGRDVIDHPPGSHDDLANAAAGALVACNREGEPFGMEWWPNPMFADD